MKNQNTYYLIVLAFLLIGLNAYPQANKIINQDTIFYESNNWNTKINAQLIPFDSTNLILKFDNGIKKHTITNYLIAKNIKLLDSLEGYYLCKLDTNWTLNKSFDSLYNTTYFESIEINSSGVLDFTPNDPLFDQQSHINNSIITSLVLDDIWEITTGDSDIKVAVIDGFIDWSHIDLGYDPNFSNDNIWKNPREVPWQNQAIPSDANNDKDNNGYRDDWKGWDFYYNTNDTRPKTIYDTHGTSVAGIIAAKTNNGIGVSGIAGGNYQLNNSNQGGIKIMPLNVCKSKSSNSDNVDLKVWNVAKAIEYAIKNDADIIALSLSLGDAEFNSNVLDKIIEKAYNVYNCILFCSAGNISGVSNSKLMNYPASNVYVYSVGALKNNPVQNSDKIGDYASGYILDFVANGFEITTLDINNNYNYNFGATSAASPQLSGITALLLSKLPCISNNLVYESLKNTARNYVNGIGKESDYQFDNNTNSNLFGYGIPEPYYALLNLQNYEVENYNVENEFTIDLINYALNDITILEGGQLTITGELQMFEDKRIIVQPGGKLVIDGGKITSRCGWKGIEVLGIQNENQNTNSFGLVELKNNATIEHAMVAIKSIDGGIVQTKSESIFRNNYQSIVFEKYKGNHQHSLIESTRFLCDGPVLRLLKGATGSVQASKEFIRITESSKIIINGCEFISMFKGKGIHSKVIGVNMYNAKLITIQGGCSFNGLSIGINTSSLNGLLNFVNIKDNNFTNVNESIKVYNSRANIHDNEFILASNAEIEGNSFIPSVGVYCLGSVVKITDNNFSSEFSDDGYGLIIRNSKTLFESKIEGNTFSNLRYGNQLEQSNRRLRLYCNSYTNISQNDWSVNPIYAGENLLPMQGTFLTNLELGKRRAGNMFYDRDLEESSFKHIRSSFGFKYNAAISPVEAVPEYITSNIIVEPFFESNDLSCSIESLPCISTPCNPSEWQELLLNTSDGDSIIFYKQELLYSISEQDDISAAANILEPLIDSLDYLELLIGIHLNLNSFELANSFLQNHPQSSQRDQDYYNFYSSILNREFNEIPTDSIPSLDIALYADILNHENDISDILKAYLNFNFDSTFIVSPELWEEQPLRPITNQEKNNKDREYNEQPKLNTLIYPNPSNYELYVSFNSAEFNQLCISITNVLGDKILNKISIKNSEISKIDTKNLPAGVYYISFISNENRIATKRIVILH